jgi:hypothetical protein
LLAVGQNHERSKRPLIILKSGGNGDQNEKVLEAEDARKAPGHLLIYLLSD